MSYHSQRNYRGDADRAAILDLWLAARALGQGDPWPGLHVLAAALTEPCGAQLWCDQHDELVAAALLLEGSVLVWAIRPGADDEAIEVSVLAWGQSQVDGGGLFVPVRDDDLRLVQLLERSGFAEEPWQMLRMVRGLLDPLTPPSLPAGCTIRPLNPPHDLAAATALHSKLFAGDRKQISERKQLMAAPGYHSQLDLIAVSPQGELVGYCLGMHYPVAAHHHPTPSGWLELIGVAAPWHGRGLGRALTLAMVEAMRAEGLSHVLLSVSADNLTARRMFEHCGFQVRHRIRWYVDATG
ncbi:GNAT family N-acetyltransferase [Candidatus Chloroploca sp. Khr17]|uniref:GNAT family N-acetyltransferase n=1 Tax=Candidatus Chloroploca sp. Khr17 TaxID=2496869 RepID=UPI0013EC5620|nr:GNAT family N-acetyltransferase [Candidatus Chloroploca sp. Khr17]